MAVTRIRSMLAAFAVCVGTTPVFAFTMGDTMATAGAASSMAAIGSRSAAPTINSVQKSLGASAQKMAQRTAVSKKPQGPRQNGRMKKLTSKAGKRGGRSSRSSRSGNSGWGNATQGWAKQGRGQGGVGGWAGSSGGWGKSAGWAGAGNTWASGGQGSGWARPGGAS